MLLNIKLKRTVTCKTAPVDEIFIPEKICGRSLALMAIAISGSCCACVCTLGVYCSDSRERSS